MVCSCNFTSDQWHILVSVLTLVFTFFSFVLVVTVELLDRTVVSVPDYNVTSLSSSLNYTNGC